jgi:hypothetical protein
MKRIVLVAAAALFATSAWSQQQPRPKYAAKVPESITTPDTVETKRLGTLKFSDGLPDEETVRKVYDNLDFSRGVQAFLTGVPAASVYATCDGFDKAGITPNEVLGFTEDLLNARSLFLTGNSATVSPKEGLFDGTWKLPDVELVK